MANLEQRINMLEMQAKQCKPIVETPEFLADFRIVDEYFESNGCKIDTRPRDDMTEMQGKILAALIELELFMG